MEWIQKMMLLQGSGFRILLLYEFHWFIL
uniref:Uncharacterized protein n=1 Tax=Musa acuminata subsp. malaccensis TaxID=214687 RepID=A0A804U5M4_MUSAM